MFFGHNIFQNPLAYQTDTKWYSHHITFLQLVSPKKKKNPATSLKIENGMIAP